MKQVAWQTLLVVAISSVFGPTAYGQDPVPPRQLPAELRKYIERFAGTSSTECGQFLLVRPPFIEAGATELERAVTCARKAAQARRSFWTAKQSQGMDSLIFDGLVGTGEGTVYRFSYDSAPCGGPHCPGLFEVEPCNQPAVMTDRGHRASIICQR
jgi:hypothetical protein